MEDKDIPARPPYFIGKFSGQQISIYSIFAIENMSQCHDEKEVNNILAMKTLYREKENVNEEQKQIEKEAPTENQGTDDCAPMDDEDEYKSLKFQGAQC